MDEARSRSRASRQPASQRIADVVADRILDGTLAPGDRIVQDDVAEEVGASRLPVREAFRILESRGLVTLKANSGAWVSQMDLRDCELSYTIRERIEPLLLVDSMGRLTQDDLDALDELVGQVEAAREVEEFLVLDRRLHWATYARHGAPMLADMVARLWDTTQHYRRAYSHLTWGQRTWVVDAEHRLLLGAVAAGDAEGASALLALHIRRTRVELTRHPELFEVQDAPGSSPATA